MLAQEQLDLSNPRPGVDLLSTVLSGSPEMLGLEASIEALVFNGLGSTVYLHELPRSTGLSHGPTEVHIAGNQIPQADLSEARLVSRFEGLVESLSPSLPDLMVPSGSSAIREPREFSLTPVVAYRDDAPITRGRSTEIHGYGIPIDPILTDLYRSQLGLNVFVDSRFGLGLDYRQKIIAVASAGVTYDGNLLINQLQAAPGTNRERGREGWERFNQSGLNHGYLWRHSLVKAWTHIAEDIGCPAVIVQSYQNSREPVVRERGKKGYDDVANDLGFRQTDDKNWRLNLQ